MAGMNMQLAKVLYAIFLFFFAYFIILIFYNILLAVIGLIEGRKRMRESEIEDYPLAYLATIALPVSIIIPARNEEGWIRDSVLSALNLNYPRFEVVIVDDGSTDRTFPILNDMLKLRPTDLPYIKHYKDGQVRGILESEKYPNVTVITKFPGVKKAGAVNAGLNLARNDYICVLDADTIIEPDALLKVMAHIERDPERVISIGSYFGLSNGLKIKDGRVVKRSFSYNPIIAYQHLEYIRSFLGNRIGWGQFNAIPVIAGGFGVWQKDILCQLGGFSLEFTCEDIEMTFRFQDYMAKNKDKKYRIMMLPYPVSWTEGPDNIHSLILQRNRWQRVTNETIWKYKYMLLNPRYRAFGFLAFPYYLFYEVLGVFFEISSIILVAAGFVFGMVDIRTFLAYLVFMILVQSFVSLLSILTFVRSQRTFKLPYVAYLIFLSFLEILWYKWIISIAKLSGMISYARKITTFDQYERAKR